MTTIPAQPIIRCRGVWKTLSGEAVLRGIDLDVVVGETLVILGGSGAGKSVLIKHMNALLRPDRGEVWIGEENITGLPESALARFRRRVGMLFQMSALFDSMTVFDNVAYPIRGWRLMPESAVADRVHELLEIVGLEGTEGLAPSELSGGMRKRAGRARAGAAGPTLRRADHRARSDRGAEDQRADSRPTTPLRIESRTTCTALFRSRTASRS
jgi:phospholipid/cholesterol/gamma-HCH transport system ATP-binding protein